MNLYLLKKYMAFAEKRKLAAGILAIAKDTGRILLARRSFDGDDHEGEWSFFGGGLEDDELPKAGAIREFQEETNFGGTPETKGKKFLLTKMPFYTKNGNHVKYFTYIGIFDNEFVVDLMHEKNFENSHYGWFHLDKLPEALHPGVKEVVEEKYDEIQKRIDFYCNL